MHECIFWCLVSFSDARAPSQWPSHISFPSAHCLPYPHLSVLLPHQQLPSLPSPFRRVLPHSQSLPSTVPHPHPFLPGHPPTQWFSFPQCTVLGFPLDVFVDCSYSLGF